MQMAAIQRGLCDRGVQVTGFCTILCGACLGSSGQQLDAAAEAAGWVAEGSRLMCCAARAACDEWGHSSLFPSPTVNR